MIRIRVGDRFKIALAGDGVAAALAEDSLGIEVDGVEISRGVLEDPLLPAVATLAETLAALADGTRRTAALPFADGRIELLLARRGPEVLLSLVSLARPARVAVRDLAVELESLVEAVRACADDLLAAVDALAPAARAHPAVDRLAEARRRLAGARPAAPPAPDPAATPARIRRRTAASDAPAFGFDLRDDEGRLAAWAGEPGLHPLLASGHVYVHGPDGEELLGVAGSPFLLLRDLSDAAARLLGAAREGQPTAVLPLGDAAALVLDLEGGACTVAGRTLRCAPEAVARAAFEAALDLGGALLARNGRLAGNPHLASLAALARERRALARELLGEAAPPPGPAPAPARLPRVPAAGPPIAAGRLRRVALREAWRAYLPPLRDAFLAGDGAWLVTDEGVALLRLADGVLPRGFAGAGRVSVVAPAERAPILVLGEDGRLAAHLPDGAELWRREGPAAHELAGRYAVVPRERKSPLAIVLAEGRSLLGLSLGTGRTVFRLAPPGATRAALSVSGRLAVLGTDAGLVYGVDAAAGRIAWRARIGLAVRAVAAGAGQVIVGAEGPSGVVLVGLDAATGAEAARIEPGLARLGALVPSRRGAIVAGSGPVGGEVLEATATGELRWRARPILGPEAPALRLAGGAVYARGGEGACRLDRGKITWSAPCGPGGAPVPLRGLVALPGERLALLEAATGAAVEVTGVGALPAADHVLASPAGTLVVGDREGAVTGLRLAGALAVVR